MSGKKQADETAWARDEALVIGLLSGHRDANDRKGWDALTRLLRAASLNEPAYRPLARKVARELMYQANRDGLRNRHFVIRHRSAGRGGGADFMRDLEIDAYCRGLEAKGEPLKKALTKFDLFSYTSLRKARQRAKHNALPSFSATPKRTGR
jgi:hypothetical protein